MVDRAGSGNQKWLKFILFSLFFVMFQVQTLAKAQTPDVIISTEFLINSEYTETRTTYSIESPVENFTCNQLLQSNRKQDYWDYRFYVKGSSAPKNNFLKTYETDMGTYVTELPCLEAALYPSAEILQTYKRIGGKKTLVKGIFYPFDRYQFNVSFQLPPRPYTTAYIIKVTLPENTVPVDTSSNISYFLRQTLRGNLTIQNETTDEFAFQGEVILIIDSQKVSSGRSFLEGPRFSIIFPQTESSTGHPISIVAQWERPPLVKFLFVASFISILILTLLLICSRESKTSDYLAHSFTIFALQEGINQLVIPAGRPLTITLFELPIMIALIAAFFVGERREGIP